MKHYEITINGKRVEAKASRAAVAVARAIDMLGESEFKPAGTIIVRSLGSVAYKYAVRANVSNGTGAYVSTQLSAFNSRQEAYDWLKTESPLHPENKFYRVVRIEEGGSHD